MTDEPDFGGWSIRSVDDPRRGVKVALHIGNLPGRKSAALYMINGSVLTPLAYFRDQESAVATKKFIDKLVGY